MDLLLILTYTAVCVAIFKIFRIPLNKWTVPTAALGGIIIIGALIILMNYNHPYSEMARNYYISTPIVPLVKGRVIEVHSNLSGDESDEAMQRFMDEALADVLAVGSRLVLIHAAKYLRSARFPRNAFLPEAIRFGQVFRVMGDPMLLHARTVHPAKQIDFSETHTGHGIG